MNTGNSIELAGFPRVSFSGNLVVNWTENTAPFYSIYPDSASIGCNIDSLLNGRVFCDTFPRTSIPFDHLTGSFKTRHFIGIREDGLYDYTGNDSCEARQISNGGWSEK